MASLAAAFDILTRGADKAARDIDHVGNASEKTGQKVERTHGQMRLLSSTFVSSSNQALGPLQEIADKFNVIGTAADGARTKAGGRLLGIGAAAVGAGSFLATLYSREQGAAQQLQASIEQTGHSYEDYGAQIEAAVKHGEHFGNQASTTLDVLNRLTLTTHDPAEAIKDLGVTIDVAAAKHIELKKAAEIVGLVFNGSARSGKQFGLQLENVTGAAQALTTAQKASASANDRVVSAQQSYNDKLAVYQQTLKPTLGQQLALYRSHQNVAKAQDDAAAASARLKTAQAKANDASAAGARNVAKLAQITKGQGEAAADTFTGKLKALGAQIEDTGGHLGKYGSDIDTAALGILGVGAVLESGLFPKLADLAKRLATSGTAFKTLRDVEVTTSAEGAAAVEAGAAAEVTALGTVDAAAATTGTALKGLVGIAAGLPGLIAAAGTAGVYELNKWYHDHPSGFYRANDPISNFLFGKRPHSQDPIDTSLLGTPGLHPQGVQTSDAYDAKTSATLTQRLGMAGQKMTAAAAELHATQVRLRDKAAKDGNQTLQAFLDSIGGGKAANAATQAAAAEAARVAKQAAVDAATAIRDTIKTEFDNAKGVLADVMSQATQLRQSIADSLVQGSQITDVFGTGPNLNGNHAFGSGQDFGAVKRFFEDRLTKLRRFAAELSGLLHKGLDPRLVAQIAQAGVDGGGGRLADALSGATRGQLGQIDSLAGQINRLGDSTGQRVADVQYREQIKAAKKTNDILSKELKEANQHLRVISRAKPGTGVDQAAAAFLTGS